MNFLKNKIRELLAFSVIFIPFSLIYTLLIYFQAFSATSTAFQTATFIIALVIFLIFGTISGRIEGKRGWLAGMTSVIIIIAIVFLFKLLLKDTFNTRYWLKIAALFFCSALGGIIGVNLTKK